MKIKTIIFITILFAIYSSLFAQTKSELFSRPINTISIGLLGEGTLFSLNYERLFPIKKHLFLSGKIGVGRTVDFCGLIHCEENYKAKASISIPHHITVNFGKKKVFLEAGYGGTMLTWNYKPKYIAFGIIGMRIHPFERNKFSFRVFATPPLTKSDDGFHYGDVLFIPLGLSFGVSF